MKKLIALFLTCTLLLAVFMPAAAEPEASEIIKGTPVVDGLLDDAYLESASHVISNRYAWSWGGYTENDPRPSTGTVYFLWDENYLYACGVVKDSTPTSQAGEKTWQNDSVEHFFFDVDENGFELGFKINHSGDGTLFLGPHDLSGQATFDVSLTVSETTYTEDGYIVEAAFPMPAMAVGKEFLYNAQLIDIWDPDYSAGYAKGSAEPTIPFVCVEGKTTTTTTTTATETQPTEGQTTTVAPETDNAQNNDVVIYIAIAVVAVAAIAAVIIVVTVKSKRKGK